MTVSASGGPTSDDVNALAGRVREALEYLHMLSRSPLVNTPVGNDALAALDGLVEAHARQEEENEALRKIALLGIAELRRLAELVEQYADGKLDPLVALGKIGHGILAELSPSERGSGGQT